MRSEFPSFDRAVCVSDDDNGEWVIRVIMFKQAYIHSMEEQHSSGVIMVITSMSEMLKPHLCALYHLCVVLFFFFLPFFFLLCFFLKCGD